MSYAPTPPQQNISWLEGELRRISEAFSRGGNALKILETFEEPDKPFDAEIRFADGTGWDPGAGTGLYIYRGGIWHLIEAGFNRNVRSMSFFLSD